MNKTFNIYGKKIANYAIAVNSLQWQTHRMVHGSFWLLLLHFRDEHCTSLTQEYLLSLRTAIIMLLMWAKFPRHTLAASMKKDDNKRVVTTWK